MASIAFVPLAITTLGQSLSFCASLMLGFVYAGSADAAIMSLALAGVVDRARHATASLASGSIHEIFKLKVLKVASNHAFFIPYG